MARESKLNLVDAGSEGLTWEDYPITKTSPEGKVFTENAKVPIINSMADVAKACKGDNESVLNLFRRSIVQAFTANVRQRVTALAGGVDKKMLKAAKLFAEAYGLPTDDASLKAFASKLKAQKDSLTASE